MKITLQRAKHLEIRKNPSIRYDFVELLATVLDLDLSVLGKFAGTTQKKTKSELGQLVRTRRKELAISIKDLAQKLNVSRQFVNQIEFGQCRLSENDEMIVKLAQVLELDINRLEVLRPERRLKQMENANPLGGFLAAKRLELRLTQREVSEHAGIASSLLSGVETGRFHPSPKLLKKLTTILKCQIPSELIPPPSDRKGFTIERETPLGQLVTTRRLELKFSQAEVARRANTSISVISSIERGTYRIGGQMVKRLSKALEFEIPIKFIPTPKQRGDREPDKKGSHLNLSDQNLVDLERIKELSDIRVNNEAVRKALKLLRILLEKQNDKYTVCLHKDKNIIELEFLF
jgi:transcriptional regulator with XRE-family HTH domain